MKNIATILLVMFFFSIVGAQEGFEDVVYLKNGSIIRGTIIEQVPNISLKIQTKDGSIFFYEITDVIKITREQILAFPETQQISSPLRYKSPGTAVILSILVPGAGQFYNDEVGKGVAFLATFVAGAVVLETVGTDKEEKQEGFYIITEEKPNGLGVLGAFAVLGSYVWSIIDAYKTAKKINSSVNNKIGFDIVKRDNVYFTRLNYRF